MTFVFLFLSWFFQLGTTVYYSWNVITSNSSLHFVWLVLGLLMHFSVSKFCYQLMLVTFVLSVRYLDRLPLDRVPSGYFLHPCQRLSALYKHLSCHRDGCLPQNTAQISLCLSFPAVRDCALDSLNLWELSDGLLVCPVDIRAAFQHLLEICFLDLHPPPAFPQYALCRCEWQLEWCVSLCQHLAHPAYDFNKWNSSGSSPVSAGGISECRASMLRAVCVQPFASSASFSHSSQPDRQNHYFPEWPRPSLFSLLLPGAGVCFYAEILWGVFSSHADVAPGTAPSMGQWCGTPTPQSCGAHQHSRCRLLRFFH